MKYSVIIPTYNRVNTLEVCLNAVCSQTINMENVEIIVIDDGSTDATYKYIDSLLEKNPNLLRYIYKANGGFASALNEGIRNANGDILFFTNDDCVVPRDWMKKLLRGFKDNPDVIGVGGHYLKSNDLIKKNIFNRVYDAYAKVGYKDLALGEMKSNAHYGPYGNTANTAYKKEIFKKLGGFSEYTKKTARIDSEFSQRCIYSGYKMLYIPLIVNDLKDISLKEFVSKSYRYGMADYYFYKRFSGMDSRVKLSNIFEKLHDFIILEKKINKKYVFLFLLLRLFGSKIAEIRKDFLQDKIPYLEIKRETIFKNEKNSFYHQNVPMSDYFFSENFVHARQMVFDNLKMADSLQKKMISIIIPFFNRKEYITDELIKNLNNSPFTKNNAEIIFIDDGSTDGTYDLLLKLRSENLFALDVKVIRRENGGPSAARNTGIRNSSGEYIVFTDSDVHIKPYQFIEFLMPFFLNKKIGLTGGGQFNYLEKSAFDFSRNKSTYNGPFHITNNIFMAPYDSACFCIKKIILEEAKCLYFDEDFKLPGSEDKFYSISVKENGLLTAYVPVLINNNRSIKSFEEFNKMIISRQRGITTLTEKLMKKGRLHPDSHQTYYAYLYSTRSLRLFQRILNIFLYTKNSKDLVWKLLNMYYDYRITNIVRV